MLKYACAAALTAALSSGVAAQEKRGTPPPGKVFKSAELSLEYPARDWEQLSGAGSVLTTLTTRRFDATVVIERSKLAAPLTSADLTDLFAEIEADLIREQFPSATGVTAALATHPKLGAVVRVDFSRPGPAGIERVRQISAPAGWYIYRVVCSARSADFPKYEATFNRVIESATITMAAPTTGGGR